MKKEKMLKNNLIMLVFIIMIFAMLFSTEVQAAKLNKTSLTLVKGKTYTLKMNGTKKKVIWKTKDKRIVKLSIPKKNSIKIKAIKAGNAAVTAKVGKKTYKCRVTVINKTNEKSSETTPASKTDAEKNTEQTTTKVPDMTPITPTKPSTAKKKVWIVTKWASSVETPVYVNERTAIECTACNYKTEDFNQAVEHQDNHIHASEPNGYRVITIFDSVNYVTKECPEEGYWMEIGTNEHPEGLKWRTDESYPEGGYYYIDQSTH